MLEDKSVLIVDDEVGIRQVLSRGIQRKFNKEYPRISILEAENGREALELARQYIPDLILMDICMPIMDGLQACRLLRQESKFSATKIIMLTSEVTKESEGLLAGADDYVIKPFDIETLLIRIERGLYKSKAAGSTQYLDPNSILSKECFLATYLSYEISRAKRYFHSLSLLLIKVTKANDSNITQENEVGILKILQRRSSDKLINWGRNTYGLLLTETSADDATFLARQISWQIEKGFRVSIGITNLEDTLVGDLVTNAESSLQTSEYTGQLVLNRLAIKR